MNRRQTGASGHCGYPRRTGAFPHLCANPLLQGTDASVPLSHMSDPSPEALRARYHPRLMAEAEALRAASGDTRTDRRPVALDQQSVGRLSRMDAMQQQAMAAAQEARRAGRLRAIEAALPRPEKEDFGWCDDCGEFIGHKRLDLDPVLMRCIACAG